MVVSCSILLLLVRKPRASFGSPLGEVEGAPLGTWKGSSQQLSPPSQFYTKLLVFQLMGWVFGSRVFFFSFLNLPSIALLIPAPDMKEISHTGVSNQTSKVVY